MRKTVQDWLHFLGLSTTCTSLEQILYLGSTQGLQWNRKNSFWAQRPAWIAAPSFPISMTLDCTLLSCVKWRCHGCYRAISRDEKCGQMLALCLNFLSMAWFLSLNSTLLRGKVASQPTQPWLLWLEASCLTFLSLSVFTLKVGETMSQGSVSRYHLPCHQ